METIPTKFKTQVDYLKAFHKLILQEIWHNICSAMDNISSGPCVDAIFSKGWSVENVFKIRLCAKKGEDFPKKGDILLLSSHNLKSRDQILKDDGLCTILLVKNSTLDTEWDNGTKRG